MSLSLPDRQHIQQLIGAPCLLTNDRQARALFFSDYSRRLGMEAVTARLLRAGCLCTPLPEGLMLIDWPPEGYALWYDALPEAVLPPYPGNDPQSWSLCRLLLQHPAPLFQQPLPALARALRLVRLGRREEAISMIGGELAAALRERRAPPSHFARLLLHSEALSV
jgi:hypothetical protein